MGIYSVLLSVGAIGGSLLAAVLGNRYAVDGLIYGTLAMAVLALFLVRRLEPTAIQREGKNIPRRELLLSHCSTSNS
jgi:hypothetical protein